MIRFSVGPSPTIASFTTNPSGFRLALFSALAIALLSVLPTKKAAFFGVKASRSSAAETGKPWISRVTSRALNGEIRAYLYVDLTSMLYSVIRESKFVPRFPDSRFTALDSRPFISNSHSVAHPPGGGPLLLFCPSLNPFPESQRRKSFVAHQSLAGSRSFCRRASLALASQF